MGVAVSLGFHISLRLWERGRPVTPLDLSPRFQPKPFPGTSLDSLLRRYGVDTWGSPPPTANPEDPLLQPQPPAQPMEQGADPDTRPPVVPPAVGGLEQPRLLERNQDADAVPNREEERSDRPTIPPTPSQPPMPGTPALSPAPPIPLLEPPLVSPPAPDTGLQPPTIPNPSG